MTLLIGVAAGVYKTARDTPAELLDTVSSITYGSFCSTANVGNAKLPTHQTELFDTYKMTSLNAKGLPNQGLEAFLRDELPQIIQMFKGKLAKIRISVSPRKAGELQEMCKLIVKYDVQDLIILEVNLACPNHRTEAGLSPILARDADAVAERLKEMSHYSGAWEVKISPDSDYTLLSTLIYRAAAYKAGGIVSANTRPGDGALDEKKLHNSVGGGGLGGAILLQDTIRQTKQLRELIQLGGSGLHFRACGGATDARAVHEIWQNSPVEVQAATVPYFLGPKAMQQLVMDSHTISD